MVTCPNCGKEIGSSTSEQEENEWDPIDGWSGAGFSNTTGRSLCRKCNQGCQGFGYSEDPGGHAFGVRDEPCCKCGNVEP